MRVSTDKQDLEKQRHLLLEYAQSRQIVINDFVEVEVSSRKDQRERKIEELELLLGEGDFLVVAELSRLGRNMLETLNIIDRFDKRGVKIEFVRQPELSTSGAHGQLLRAIYGYFAEAEREYISMRTKQGLEAARAQGKTLGRPKGSKNKAKALDSHREAIKDCLRIGLNVSAIQKVINDKLDTPMSYTAYKYFITQDTELNELWRGGKK
jgi:DNA invertase Pin-like site-specific DNA recombinase